MREWGFAAALLAAACDRAGHRPEGPPLGPGIVTSEGGEADTGDEPRLDLGAVSAIPDLPDEVMSSTGGPGDEGSTSTGATSSSGGEPSTSTGEASSSSSGEAGSSTGEPAPICGDGVCDPAERAPCWSWVDGHWGPGFCAEDCMADPACVAVLDCPCTPEAAAVKSWCFADPVPACGATAPGGACSISDALAFFEWNAKCGG